MVKKLSDPNWIGIPYLKEKIQEKIDYLEGCLNDSEINETPLHNRYIEGSIDACMEILELIKIKRGLIT